MIVGLREVAAPELIHRPDIQFAVWCFEQYGLNKGVYNTIDERLFESGLTDIVSRRAALLSFLEQAKRRGVHIGESKFLRFGKGGLTAMLNDFLQAKRAD